MTKTREVRFSTPQGEKSRFVHPLPIEKRFAVFTREHKPRRGDFMARRTNWVMVDFKPFKDAQRSDDYLSDIETEDVRISRSERAVGESRRFSTAEELFAWLDSE